ncbi:hypothetical protein [Geomonas paludis]|uniref:hypothetical protein n=1 Tax=Geomonas paludis TaxID=2740185 RepID=UPI0016147CE2|nr:hypothetical protein [Geomonas paludis]
MTGEVIGEDVIAGKVRQGDRIDITAGAATGSYECSFADRLFFAAVRGGFFLRLLLPLLTAAAGVRRSALGGASADGTVA